MPRILHLSYDLRDRRGRPVTTAVRELIDVSRRLAEVEVIDLLRVPPPAAERAARPPGEGLQIDSWGLPFGLFLRAALRRSLRKIEEAGRRGLLDLAGADCIHAHKTTFEGFIGYRLSRRLDIPLMVTLRQTDHYVLRYRPDFRRVFRETLMRSSAVFYITPYVLDLVRRYAGGRFFEQHVAGKLFFLPNIVEREGAGEGAPSAAPSGAPAGDAAPAGGALPGEHLLTILRMTRRSVKRKNIRGLLAALQRLGPGGPSLEVIGDGEYLPVVRGWVRRLGLEERVRFLGDVPNRRIDPYLRAARAFVLPSTSETFGMVYAEALLNGTPILYSRGTGFDGMFEGVGAAVDARSVQSIAGGLRAVVARNGEYRDRIARLKDSGAFRIFGRPYAQATYAQALQRALAAQTPLAARSRSGAGA